jgi:hypothetical protein
MNVLTPNEIAITGMALAALIEDLEITSKDATLPFTPDARKDMSEMLSTAKSAQAKFELATGHEVRLDPFVEGDEKEFLTKES